jgi:hypothetical protein
MPKKQGDGEELFLRGSEVFLDDEGDEGTEGRRKMSQGKWVSKWRVQSTSDDEKTYIVSQAEDGSYGCSCPQWRFRHSECKHIREVAEMIVGLVPTEQLMASRLRFIATMNGIKLSCDNCNGNCSSNWKTKRDLIFIKRGTLTFYILGRCCTHYEKKKDI